jgi:hypothetical protein
VVVGNGSVQVQFRRRRSQNCVTQGTFSPRSMRTPQERATAAGSVNRAGCDAAMIRMSFCCPIRRTAAAFRTGWVDTCGLLEEGELMAVTFLDAVVVNHVGHDAMLEPVGVGALGGVEGGELNLQMRLLEQLLARALEFVGCITDELASAFHVETPLCKNSSV